MRPNFIRDIIRNNKVETKYFTASMSTRILPGLIYYKFMQTVGIT